VKRIEKSIGAHKDFGGLARVIKKRSLRRPRRKWEDNIEKDH
jgi:hypothetical protein